MKLLSRSQKLGATKIIAVGLLLLFTSCGKPTKRLKNVQFIKEKIIAFKLNNGNYATEKIQNINHEDYVVERKVIYNSKGKATEVYHGASEGFIVYSNPPQKNITMPFDSSTNNIKISINTKEDYILDNNQKIDIFEVSEKERLIIGKENTNGRVIFLRY